VNGGSSIYVVHKATKGPQMDNNRFTTISSEIFYMAQQFGYQVFWQIAEENAIKIRGQPHYKFLNKILVTNNL